MGSAELAVSISDFTLQYRGRGPAAAVVEAVRDLSFDIAQGSFVSIVGPSGCGKSTLLRCMLGGAGGVLSKETTWSSGQLTVGGQTVTGAGIRATLRGNPDVAMVFQAPLLLPWLTTIENVALGLDLRKVSKSVANQRAKSAIELVGLGGFENHHPRQLSGGMQQRANLARALVLEPSVLLLDEPFAALDSYTRSNMQEELVRIWDEVRCTALFVTHDISEAVYLADRVIIMKARPGEVAGDLTVDLPRPRTRQTKADERFVRMVTDITNRFDTNFEEAR